MEQYQKKEVFSMDEEDKSFAQEVDWQCIGSCGAEITRLANEWYYSNEPLDREECDELIKSIKDEVEQIQIWLDVYDEL